MKSRKYFFLLLFFVCFGASAQQGSVPRPKLVVGIVIDQMRWDYLYKFYNRYGKNGFKRLLTEGMSCENTMLAHIPSYTAVGHSSIYTGSVPAIDGITANDMVDQKTGKTFYCTSDSTVTPVGTTSKEGLESPRNLWVTTIGDELRLATNFHSKVIGISLKDRASILPAGKSANAAYWFDSSTGHFITSSYYMDQLPSWVVAFNNKNRVEALMSGEWEPLYDIKSYDQSCPDDNRYERPFFKGEKPILPIDLARLLKEGGFEAIKSVPMGNTFTLEMAESAINGEHLGKGDYTDFLAISCSSTDYIGHRFGVNAIETEDTYLRLDKDLGDFFSYLDAKIGKGNYTLFLTADHAAAHNYNFLKDHKINAGGFEIKSNMALLDSTLNARFGIKGLVCSLENYQINFDYKKIAQEGLKLEEVKQAAMDCARHFDGVLYVEDQANVSSSTLPDQMKKLMINSYVKDRSGEVQILVKPGYYEVWSKADSLGTTHGTWAPYDLHIPLLFMGWGINPGKLNREVYMTDIAPTITELLHVQMPNGCVGKTIPEVLK
jgi:predicted AlkP superfamily pyrophosphatase or phosphodiesterase